MKIHKELWSINKLTLAVQGALIAMLAMPMLAFAEDSDVKALTHPENTIDLSVGNVSAKSAKFGEYSGLNQAGAYANGDFSIRGGDAYDAFSGGEGTWRWQFKGTDIGTTSRALSEEVSDQGKWNFGISFDQLRHQITDTYQTPYQGMMGGNNFTLPSNFGFINTGNVGVNGYVGTNASNTGTPIIQNGFTPKGAQILSPSQLADFNTTNVYSERQNASVAAGFNFDQHFAVKFDFNQLVQSGAKLMNYATDGTTAGGPSGSKFTAEAPIMLPNPTDYKTDTVNLALNWTGDKAYGTASYYLSAFTDYFNGVNFADPLVNGGTLLNYNPNSQVISATAYPINQISTAPSNSFQQLNLNGGYTFTPATKLTVGLSSGRNTQNENYMSSAIMVAGVGAYPQSSLNGLVLTTHYDAKLTDQTTKDLQLSAGYKYNKRDNQTASNQYAWMDLNPGAELARNIPMSNTKAQLELAADYRINHDNRVHFGLEQEKITRSCNDPTIANAQQTITAGGGATGQVATGYTASGCAQVPDSTENKLAVDYKLRAGENVNLNAGYGYGNRSVDTNTFYSPLHANTAGYEDVGYVAFFQAARVENLVKAGINWQAAEKLNLSLNGRYTKDSYGSTLGVTDGYIRSANADVTYSYSENTDISAYVSWQDRQQNFTNGLNCTGPKAASGSTPAVAGSLACPSAALTNTQMQVTTGTPYSWDNNQADNSTTIGLRSKQKGVIGGKFTFSEDVTYSIDKSSYSSQSPFYGLITATSGGLSSTATLATVPTCSSSASDTCTSTPDIKSEMVRVNLAGSYQIDKSNKVNMGYLFQRLVSYDYYYNALQYGYNGSTQLATNQQAPGYTVNVVSASYVYSF